MIDSLKQLRAVLADGLRGALLVGPREGAFRASLGVALALCALNLLASLALTYALWRGSVWFNPYGVAGDIAAYGLLLAYLAILPLSLGGLTAGRVFVGAIATGLPILLAATGLCAAFLVSLGDTAVAVPFAVGWLVFFWFLLALAKLVHALALRARWLMAPAVVAASLLATFTLPYRSAVTGIGEEPQGSLLETAVALLRPAAPASTPTAAPPPLDAEALFHRQPSLLRQNLDALQAPQGAKPNLYFVGVAPDAQEDVFKREVMAVRSLLDARFATAGRSLVLVNHRETLNDFPLASLSNLETALVHIGKLMRRETDVLVLFVTSHGVKGAISVRFEAMPLNTMTAERLAAALDRANIKNRILILSACYSGSLIPALRSDTTLILTAAHGDKTSFGCSNENAWTYFGDAYFNHALRRETSFLDAFATAKELISRWEQRDRLTPSEPQMFVGAQMRGVLKALPAPGAAR